MSRNGEKVCCLTVYQVDSEGNKIIVGQSLGDVVSMAMTLRITGSSSKPDHDFGIWSTDIPWDLSPTELAEAIEECMDTVVKYKPLSYNTYYEGGLTTMEKPYKMCCLSCHSQITDKYAPCPHCNAPLGSWDLWLIKVWSDGPENCLEYHPDDILDGKWPNILPHYVPLKEGKRIYEEM